MKTNTHKLPILLALIALVLAALACGGNFSTANITSAALYSDSAGTQATTVFSQDQIFYAIVELANAPDTTTLKASWIGISLEGEEPNIIIDETEVTVGEDDTFTFNLENDQLWPVGTYKVDIYLNDELDRTLNFEVR
jgi:hypothetical protein